MNSSKSTSLDSMKFYLLHLSLMREYLDIEFQSLSPSLAFEYSLENVIDDFILLAVFVGNDFLPELPGFHIRNNGLEKLIDMYKTVLPNLDGYVNDTGVIHLGRLQVLLHEMAKLDQKAFEKEYAYLKGLNENPGKQATSNSEQGLFDKVVSFVPANCSDSAPSTLRMINAFTPRERNFLIQLADDLNLDLTWNEYDDNDNSIAVWRLTAKATDDDNIVKLNTAGDTFPIPSDKSDVLSSAVEKYANCSNIETDGARRFDAQYDDSVQDDLGEWKRRYYKEKLGISRAEEIESAVLQYMQGLQWVMRYYYAGVPSWSWFYGYYYAPRAADLHGIDQMGFSPVLGQPFELLEQLMAVLPPASRCLVPEAFRDLMTNPDSPILDFYPMGFEQDLDRNKQEWEAIVRIPFIDADRLLGAMEKRKHRLVPEERKRNLFAPTWKLSHTFAVSHFYPAPKSSLFHDIHRSHCDQVTVDFSHSFDSDTKVGLCEGVSLGADSPAGFPSLHTLPNSATLGAHNLNVHGPETSRPKINPHKSVLVTIENQFGELTTNQAAEAMIGERMFVGWLFIWEGLVHAIADSTREYKKVKFAPSAPLQVISAEHTFADANIWKGTARSAEWTYLNRHGMKIGEVAILVYIRPLRGMKRLENGASVKEYEDGRLIAYPIQTCLQTVPSKDPCFTEVGPKRITDLYPVGIMVMACILYKK